MHKTRWVCFVLAFAVAACAGLATSVNAAPAPAESASATIDINKAGVDELMTVRGIGPSLARKIVEFRQENGPFEKVDELLAVRGVGPKLLEKIRTRLVVGEARARR